VLKSSVKGVEKDVPKDVLIRGEKFDERCGDGRMTDTVSCGRDERM
jgi:hypothetical protein